MYCSRGAGPGGEARDSCLRRAHTRRCRRTHCLQPVPTFSRGSSHSEGRWETDQVSGLGGEVSKGTERGVYQCRRSQGGRCTQKRRRCCYTPSERRSCASRGSTRRCRSRQCLQACKHEIQVTLVRGDLGRAHLCLEAGTGQTSGAILIQGARAFGICFADWL